MRRRDLVWATALVVALSAMAFNGGGSVSAGPKGGGGGDSLPANKVAVSGSALQKFRCDSSRTVGEAEDPECPTLNLAGDEIPEGPVVILEGTLKTSGPTDLILQTAMECALWTDTTTIGNDSPSSAKAEVKAFITLNSNDPDVNRIPVSSGPEGDAEDPDESGKVVMCNRAFGATMSNFSDQEHTLDLFNRTKAANAFNWITLNVGSGVHTIRLWAELDVQVSGTALAVAAVAKRTLIVEPTKFANDATI